MIINFVLFVGQGQKFRLLFSEYSCGSQKATTTSTSVKKIETFENHASEYRVLKRDKRAKKETMPLFNLTIRYVVVIKALHSNCCSSSVFFFQTARWNHRHKKVSSYVSIQGRLALGAFNVSSMLFRAYVDVFFRSRLRKFRRHRRYRIIITHTNNKRCGRRRTRKFLGRRLCRIKWRWLFEKHLAIKRSTFWDS